MPEPSSSLLLSSLELSDTNVYDKEEDRLREGLDEAEGVEDVLARPRHT